MNDAPMSVGPLKRRQTRAMTVSWQDHSVVMGGGAPVVVQSMTNTDTADAIATAIQVKDLARAGSELVRITVNTPAAAEAVPAIRDQLDRMGVHVPLVGDFHYNGHKLLQQVPGCAQALSKYRINPGNVGAGRRRDDNFAQMIEVACRHEKPVRIGVNWGSLDQDLLARLMDTNAARPNPWDAQSVMREALVATTGTCLNARHLRPAAPATRATNRGRNSERLPASTCAHADAPPVHRSTAAPMATPAPAQESATTSPDVMRPCCTAASSAIGRLAAPTYPTSAN